MSDFDKLIIREVIKQHDRYQFETRFDYYIDKSVHAHFDLKKTRVFQQNIYMFFPKLMGINAKTYKKSHFYEDIRNLVRFKEPHFKYDQFISPDGPLGKISLLLEKCVHATEAEKLILKNEAFNQIKYFSCTYVGGFRRKIKKKCRMIKEFTFDGQKSKDSEKEIVDNLIILLKRYLGILERFSSLKNIIKDENLFFEHILLEMRLAEEYCFYRFREGLAYAVEIVNGAGVNAQNQHVERLRWRLKAWTRFINWYEKKFNFLSVGEKSSSGERENFLLRLGKAKKYLSRILYLDLQPSFWFSLQTQTNYMVAAAIAALWYFLANIFIFSHLQFGGFGSVGDLKNLLGFGGTSVVLAFVVAYVLKDRIKEIGRVRLRGGVLKKTPDYVNSIYYNRVGYKRPVYIGKISELVEFIDYNSIPEELRKIRSQGEYWEKKDEFDIICYQKKVELDAHQLNKIKPEFYYVKHITRFSVRRFLTKLDDPIQVYLGLDKKGNVQKIEMPKVYYIGIAVDFNSMFKKQGASGFDYQTLVVDKNGLVRIDEVARSVRFKQEHKNNNAKNESVKSKS